MPRKLFRDTTRLLNSGDSFTVHVCCRSLSVCVQQCGAYSSSSDNHGKEDLSDNNKAVIRQTAYG